MLIFFIFCLIKAVSPDGSGGQQYMSLGLSDSYSYNIRLSHPSPRSIEVTWSCKSQIGLDKYEVTLKPVNASYKIVQSVTPDSCNLRMENRLQPDTEYTISVTSVYGRNRKRSSARWFRTPKESTITEIIEEDDPAGEMLSKDSLKLPRVRLVEISLVGMALVLWAGAIVLFFHRWGKIRMLLPYQPAYKEMTQTNSACTNCSLTPHHQCNRLQQIQIQADYGASTSAATRSGVPMTEAACSPMRPRLNSFIGYNQSDIPEVPVRVCRKAKSAEQLARYDDYFFDYPDPDF